jgi:hypothetical protein
MGTRARAGSFLRRHGFGLAAIFIALGGTAYAGGLIGSEDLRDDGVRSVDIRDDTLQGGGLRAADLRPGSIGPSELDDSAFSPADIGRGSPGQAFDIVPGAIQTSEVTNGTLVPDDLARSTFGFDGHDDYSDHCDTPADNSFVVCTGVSFDLGHAMRVLATLGGGAANFSNDDNAFGECQVRLDGADKLEPISVEGGAAATSVGMPTITDVMNLGAGQHTVELACRENTNDVHYTDLTVSVVELGFD